MTSSRSLTLGIAAAAMLLFGLAGVSEAGQLTLNQETGKYSGADGGGEFKVTGLNGFPTGLPAMGTDVQVTTNGVTGAFQTFCLEYTEHFTPGIPYNYTVSTDAIGGAGGAVNGSDPIDARTAYLYTEFWNGTLSWVNGVAENYIYTLGSGRVASATELQRAIWYIEGERTLSDIGGTGSDAYAMVLKAAAAVANGGSWWMLNHDAGGVATIGDVRVVNLTDMSNGGLAQSQLTRIVVVPVPSAALLGMGMMSGVGLLGLARRRKAARRLTD